MKTKRTELNVAELIETIGGVSVINGLEGGWMPAYVGGATVSVPKPSFWDVISSDPYKRKRRP